MATYNNLASLEGLQVGDVIQYTTNTTIDFKGYTVSVKSSKSYTCQAVVEKSNLVG